MRLLSSVFLCLIILGGCNGSSILLIGSDGGKVTSDDGLAVLIIPKDALLNPVEITLKRDTSILADSAGAYILEPDGTTFDIPARIEITLKDNSDDGLSFSPSILFLESSSTVSLVDSQSDILKDKDLVISGNIPHFSRLIWIEQSNLRLRGTEPPFSLLVGSEFETTMSLSVGSNNPLGGKVFSYQNNTSPIYPAYNPDLVQIAEEVNHDGTSLGIMKVDSSTPQVFVGELTTGCSAVGLGTFTPAIVILEALLKEEGLNNMFLAFTTAGTPGGVTPDLTFTPKPDITLNLGIKRTIECREIIEDGEDPIIEPPPPEPVVVTPSSNPLIATHIYGTSKCPQEVGTITVKNNGTSAIPLDVDIPVSAAVSVDPPSGTSIAPDETIVVKVFFTCADTSGVNNAITVNGKLVGVDVTVTGAP